MVAKNMEPIELTARFDEQGTITPLHFTWNGNVLKVESIGRRWVNATGQHFLVMVFSGKIYELIYKCGEGTWFIRQAGSGQKFV